MRKASALWWPTTIKLLCAACFNLLGEYAAGDLKALGHNPIQCQRCSTVNAAPHDLLRKVEGSTTPADPDNPPGRAEVFDSIVGNLLLREAIEIALAGHHTLTVVGRGDDNWRQVHAILGDRAVRIQRCPCGNYGRSEAQCKCTLPEIEKHRKTRAYGDAASSDLIVETHTPHPEEIWATHEPFANVLTRIKRYRLLQPFGALARFDYEKREGRFSKKDETFEALVSAKKEYDWGSDSLVRVQYVARTIATLRGATIVSPEHMNKAIMYKVALIER
jgi:predicted ATPase with chaperone activity